MQKFVSLVANVPRGGRSEGRWQRQSSTRTGGYTEGHHLGFREAPPSKAPDAEASRSPALSGPALESAMLAGSRRWRCVWAAKAWPPPRCWASEFSKGTESLGGFLRGAAGSWPEPRLCVPRCGSSRRRSSKPPPPTGRSACCAHRCTRRRSRCSSFTSCCR